MKFDLASSTTALHTQDMTAAVLEAAIITILPEDTALGLLEITDEGYLRVAGKPNVQMTKHALDTLCNVLGIPYEFASVIPTELLLINIRTLLKEREMIEVTVLYRDRPEKPFIIAAIVPFPYKESPTLDVLSLFVAYDPNEIHYIEVHETLTTISALYTPVQAPVYTIKEMPRESLQAGVQIFTSVLGAIPTQAMLMLYRPASNSAMLLPFFSVLKLNYNRAREKGLLSFQEKISDVLSSFLSERLRTLLYDIKSVTLRETEWSGIWQKLSISLGQTEADRLMQTNLDTRSTILSGAMHFGKERKEARIYGTEAPESPYTTLLPYMLAVDIAVHAKKFSALMRFELEKLAGDIVLQYVLRV